jgi:hypothetical protein
MQFSVPQFTDVEDRIIGPLTIKQFGIVFAAGAFIFLLYSATKSILVLVFLCVVIGIPALALAFAKVNGRPLYNSILVFFKFLSIPKKLVFHKEVILTKIDKQADDKADKLANSKKEAVAKPSHKTTLAEVQKILAENQAKQKEMIDKM